MRADDLVSKDIDAYLRKHQQKSMLRFITCGSVDDGKSTLIGRLLYDSKLIFEDQLAVLEADSKRIGTQGQNIDFALLVDGLAAEREQGITIDVAYRFFSTDTRKFIVADTPGHEQYTRNMVTAASTADLAVILIDARQGVLTQTKRHSYLIHLLGVRDVVVAVTKMDLVNYAQDRFDAIVADYREFAQSIGIERFTPIPISGLNGDNVTTKSERMPWHAGPALLQLLENVPVDSERLAAQPFRMAVQWVNRPNLDFRGFSGWIESGTVRPGDTIRILPSGRASRIQSIVTFGGKLPHAVAGQSVTLTLSDEVDCSRGDLIVASDAPLEVADQFEATIVWMDEQEMLPGRPYRFKLGASVATATITKPKYQIDVDNIAHVAADTLALNAIGVCNLSLDRPIPFDAYENNPDLGGFILIDRITNRTVAGGMIHFALRRSHNIHWQSIDIGRDSHSAQKNQKPALLWFTGLSGSGKSTIANLVERKLFALGKHSFLLDGDNIRHGLNRDLGFTDADRVENIRRVGEVAKLMTNAGLIVLTAFISPFRSERNMVRQLMADGDFVEIFIDTPLAVAEQRDVKGLYKKARAGQLKNFTGVDSPYEPPQRPDIHIDTTHVSPEAAADTIVEFVLGTRKIR
ncbi:MAG TPA: sulfate adenylyltransferase subunit CysN [Rudaea sp.]|nr:sulfate adenylyltransferase subunit CysN [Rudaea sp.]